MTESESPTPWLTLAPLVGWTVKDFGDWSDVETPIKVIDLHDEPALAFALLKAVQEMDWKVRRRVMDNLEDGYYSAAQTSGLAHDDAILDDVLWLTPDIIATAALAALTETKT